MTELEQIKADFILALTDFIIRSKSLLDLDIYKEYIKANLGHPSFCLIVSTTEKNKVMGFAFLQLERIKTGQNVCNIHTAYIKKGKKMTHPLWRDGYKWIENWAKEKGCVAITCQSQHTSRMFERLMNILGMKELAKTYYKELETS